MRKTWGILIASLLMVSVFLVGCKTSTQGTEGNKEEKVKIITTIAQIAEPLSIIGGEYVDVQSLMGPGVDPHLYTAAQGDIQKMEQADMIFYSGLHLEANMVKVFNEFSKSKPVLAIGEKVPEDELLKDEKGAIDPHIWFDIDLWKEALTQATEELKEYSPEHSDNFEKNKQKYFGQLDAFKLEAEEKLKEIPEEKRVLVTAHDAFGYFGRMLDLEVVGLQGLSTESEIGLTDIEDTIDLLLTHQVPAVFIESSINPASINAVIEGATKEGLGIELGGELYSDAMGDENSKEGTYLGMFQHNVDTIYNALTREVE
ncbi:metal ABC transporter solute-binding protein, Zn/Mn family [Bacillus sp. B1-b2]|uniref:metal ABC transporter solute-binding protein, Zn/Mn family n=1 Tax=Bacillus sp. B1-b2 TaxID=2653201 RepID=UPI001261A27E|nr:zinc ABC transporter substrate-binding protein [Bacillus sp. B1-b2]KAB7671847.1 manganese transporter [Bacillus sp. B1-b2]